MRLTCMWGDVVILTVLCVGAMFLFPVAHGPYSAVHGPTTTLGALRWRRRLQLAFALASSALAPLLAPPWFVAALAAWQISLCCCPTPELAGVPLRC